jgi:hypothetical protein
MTQLVPGEAGIGEEQVSQSAPLVRALAVQRLEMIWQACEPHINLTQDDLDLGRKPDPRFVEAGIRVVDRLVGIYGLLKPQASTQDLATESNESLLTMANERIVAIEQRLKDRDKGDIDG